MSCLTIQNRVDFYCSLRTVKDISSIQEQLLTPKNQDQAERVKVLIQNPQVLNNKAAFSQLMQLIGKLPYLTEFSLSMLQNKRLPASSLALLLRNATHLQQLHLEDFKLDGSPYELAEVLKYHPTLQTIQLVRCFCSPVHVLLQALARMPHLHSLTLDGSILAQQSDADALAALADIVRSQSLQELHITGMEESRTITQPLLAMMEALQQPHKSTPPPNLSVLSLQTAPHETIPSIVVHAMARMLLTNTSLHTIIVPWTGGGDVWLPMIDALKSNSTLKQFRLHPESSREDRLSQPVLQHAAAALRDHNTRLSYFWYDNWEDIDLEIDLYIKSNLLGRGHLVYDDDDIVDHRPTHDEWVSALVSSRDHVHVTNYWLTQNPSLLVTAAAKTA
jgi:hypothetical protein